MIERPDAEVEFQEQGKLVLPAPPDGESHTTGNQLPAHVRPEWLISQKSPPPPQQPFAKLHYFWRKDPAYKVLIIAVTMIVLTGIFFISLASAAFIQLPDLLSRSTTQSPPTVQTTNGPVDLIPTFGAPGSSQGSTTSSQPPAYSTPVIHITNPPDSITPTAQPDPNPNPTPTTNPGSTLTIQITNIPSQVTDNTIQIVSVNSSVPGVTVQLNVSYNAYPPFYQSKSQVTDGNGNADLNWVVRVYKRNRGNIYATVVAVAYDQNGQSVSSAPMTVQITAGGIGI